MRLTENQLRKIIRNIILEGADNVPDRDNPKPYPGQEHLPYIYYKVGDDWYTQYTKNNRIFKLSGNNKYSRAVKKLNSVDWPSLDTQARKKQPANRKGSKEVPDKNNPKPFPEESEKYVYYKEGGDWYTLNTISKTRTKLSGNMDYLSTVRKLNNADWSQSPVFKQQRKNVAQKSSNRKNSWKGKEGIYMASNINFHKLKDRKNNYRAGINNAKKTRPGYPYSKEFFEGLSEDFGIENVITLNRDHNPGTIKSAKAAGLNTLEAYTGVGVVNVEGKEIETLDMDKDTWNKIYSMLDKGNTLIHCTHGADRTGATVARWYIESGKMTVDEALRDAYQYKGGGERYFYDSMKRFITHGVEGGTSKSKDDETVYDTAGD